MGANFGKFATLKNTVGKINFGEFERLFSIKQSILAEETLANLWSSSSANVFASKVSLHTVDA